MRTASHSFPHSDAGRGSDARRLERLFASRPRENLERDDFGSTRIRASDCTARTTRPRKSALHPVCQHTRRNRFRFRRRRRPLRPPARYPAPPRKQAGILPAISTLNLRFTGSEVCFKILRINSLSPVELAGERKGLPVSALLPGRNRKTAPDQAARRPIENRASLGEGRGKHERRAFQVADSPSGLRSSRNDSDDGRRAAVRHDRIRLQAMLLSSVGLQRRSILEAGRPFQVRLQVLKARRSIYCGFSGG